MGGTTRIIEQIFLRIDRILAEMEKTNKKLDQILKAINNASN